MSQIHFLLDGDQLSDIKTGRTMHCRPNPTRRTTLYPSASSNCAMLAGIAEALDRHTRAWRHAETPCEVADQYACPAPWYRRGRAIRRVISVCR